jgi:hypothetical protein
VYLDDDLAHDVQMRPGLEDDPGGVVARACTGRSMKSFGVPTIWMSWTGTVPAAACSVVIGARA